jgi:predicted nucleotidyltransferase
MQRQEILELLKEKLPTFDSILAAWVAGSAAFGRVDEWSDIDLSVLAAEGEVDNAFSSIESLLTSISPIELMHPVLQSPWPGLKQRFYRLKDLGEFLLFDIAVFQPSSPDLFLDEARHGKAIVLFDKVGAVKPPSFDEAALKQKIQERLSVLKTQFPMFQMLSKKELRRGNFVEALEFYRNYTLRPLVEVIRIKHDPARYDYHIRYLRYDVPVEARQLLESLYYVSSPDELEEKRALAEARFWEYYHSLT